MRAFVRVALLALAASVASGCSLMAPNYSPSLPNMQLLKDGGDAGVAVGEFTSNDLPGITLRGSSLNSPYANSYSAYLAEALRQELQMAGRLSSTSPIQVSGTLIRNDIDVSGFSVGKGTVEARFVVKKGGVVRYEQIKRAHTEWESSFAGPVAIPRGQQEYSHLIQVLLGDLFSDQSFMAALK